MTLLIQGLHGATVANNSILSPFGSDFITQELPPIHANGCSQLTVGSPFKLKAPNKPQDAQTLVKSTLKTWDANLDHILNGHSDPLAEPKATFTTHGENGVSIQAFPP